ncbi:LysR family transcriptional regulator [Shewanella sp. VB17]|uniref:LysR family transcriptional regulator n=1 Tax=Shewanella sp. VB17 TaxID=2739432 RepID=UPI001564FDA4|nr:LysR family transcriptional regulator [Shewanella sp. VB17]NRD74224.1 LysR family transcriptional regulator [Shewanella sp. VB17]
MIDELKAMAIFAHTVDEGSFRRAARILGLSPSVVSHHIKHLERRLGVALLYRSTRKLSLTSAGALFYPSCRDMLLAANSGLTQINQDCEQPTGCLKITLPSMLSQASIMENIATFIRLYPKIELQLNFSDRAVDLINEGIDMAIRIGPLKDSALKARLLFTMPRALVMSAEFAQQYPCNMINDPNDLVQLPWIGLSVRTTKKVFLGPQQQRLEIAVNSQVTVDDLHAQISLAKAGLGLITPPLFMVQEALATGQLTPLLKAWQPEPLGVYIVWPAQAKANSLTQRLIQTLTAPESPR